MAVTLQSHRVAVTGPTGFIGMHLLRELHVAGAEIVAITEAGRHLERLDTLPFRVQTIRVPDISHIGDAVRQAEASHVIHLSAFVSTERSPRALDETVRQNLLPAISLLAAAAETQTQRVILLGSCEEYSEKATPFDTRLATDPSSPYGASKAAVTAYARMFNNCFELPTVVLRPSVVYGPGQSDRMLISQVMRALSENRTVDVSAGAQTRDFVYVGDVVKAIVRSLVAPGIEGNVWNVGSGEVVAVRDCLERIERIAGRSDLILFGARPYSENEIFSYEPKVQETFAALDWKPSVMLEDGLEKTWASFRDTP